MPIDDKITVADSLVLGTWEAITLLGQAHERCNEADVAELLEKAQSILISIADYAQRRREVGDGLILAAQVIERTNVRLGDELDAFR